MARCPTTRPKDWPKPSTSNHRTWPRTWGAPVANIHMSRADIEATRRAVHRDGIHFYNYYNLPAPKGQVARVILDILCPAERLPAQNNGHLEPAITINLGPGHINGLWGDEVNETLPIRLTPMTATCRVPPLSRVKLGIGWSRGVARDAEQ